MGNAQMVVHMENTHSGLDDPAGGENLRSTGLRAEALLASRRLRDTVFVGHVDGFGEPAWDMLLTLFAEKAKGRPTVTTGELLAATATPEEIARVFIAWLASHRLVTREGDAVAMTERGQGLMTAYLDREHVSNRR